MTSRVIRMMHGFARGYSFSEILISPRNNQYTLYIRTPLMWEAENLLKKYWALWPSLHSHHGGNLLQAHLFPSFWFFSHHPLFFLSLNGKASESKFLPSTERTLVVPASDEKRSILLTPGQKPRTAPFRRPQEKKKHSQKNNVSYTK